MNFWDEISQASEAVNTGKINQEPPELANLPGHVKQHLMTGTPSAPGGSMPTGGRMPNNDPAFRNLPDHLKNNPYAHLSREELLDLYEKMKKDPAAYQANTRNIDKEMQEKAMRDGKPIIDEEGG